MKSMIIYYSYSGNTKKIAQELSSALQGKGDVAQIELTASDESGSFLNQCRRAALRIKAKLQPVNFDLSGYDTICLGTPVWAFAPTPAMNAYLNQCSGVANKEVILFTTSGGMGDGRCLNYMQNILSKKGAQNFKKFSIPEHKIRDKDFVLSQIKQVVD